jgi:hypothetical protein
VDEYLTTLQADPGVFLHLIPSADVPKAPQVQLTYIRSVLEALFDQLGGCNPKVQDLLRISLSPELLPALVVPSPIQGVAVSEWCNLLVNEQCEPLFESLPYDEGNNHLSLNLCYGLSLAKPSDMLKRLFAQLPAFSKTISVHVAIPLSKRTDDVVRMLVVFLRFLSRCSVERLEYSFRNPSYVRSVRFNQQHARAPGPEMTKVCLLERSTITPRAWLARVTHPLQEYARLASYDIPVSLKEDDPLAASTYIRNEEFDLCYLADSLH